MPVNRNLEKDGFDGAPVHFSSEKEDNNVFLSQMSSDKSLSKDNAESDDEESWNNVRDDLKDLNKSNKLFWMDFGATVNGRKKLIRILQRDILMAKQQWSLQNILAIKTRSCNPSIANLKFFCTKQ